jgi:hypothetical protein
MRELEEIFPPGLCHACARDVARYAPVGPIVITITDPELIGPDDPVEHTFCCWACAADFFQVQAGRKEPPRLKIYCKDAGTA